MYQELINTKIQLLIASAPAELARCQVTIWVALGVLTAYFVVVYYLCKKDKDAIPPMGFASILVIIILLIVITDNYTEMVAINSNPESWANKKIFNEIVRAVGR